MATERGQQILKLGAVRIQPLFFDSPDLFEPERVI
jgi:hypothetical protein